MALLRGRYDWIDGQLIDLRRDFLVTDLLEELESADVDATVVVQARQTDEETRWLLSVARETPQIFGVVGWADIAAIDFQARIAQLGEEPRLVGLRHIVQAEAPGFLDHPAFNRGMEAMHEVQLTYDILIYEHQLDEAIRFVDKHPQQQFVLDHIAKPRIATRELEPWKQRITELARRPNVCCKVSGMVNEADPKAWTSEQLYPYLDAVVDAFGTMRLMAGSDWPVCLAGVSYKRWWDLLREYFAEFSDDERQSIFNGCANRVYRLDSLSAPQ